MKEGCVLLLVSESTRLYDKRWSPAGVGGAETWFVPEFDHGSMLLVAHDNRIGRVEVVESLERLLSGVLSMSSNCCRSQNRTWLESLSSVANAPRRMGENSIPQNDALTLIRSPSADASFSVNVSNGCERRRASHIVATPSP